MTLPASAVALARGLALEAAQPDEAFACFLEATSLDPDNGRAWRQLGNLLRRVDRLAEASECFERALVAGDDAALNTFFLSAVGVGPVADAAPPAFVSALFDQYAERFDAHLRGELRYRAPERLAALLVDGGGTPSGAAPGSVLDLGCGTGLMGEALSKAISVGSGNAGGDAWGDAASNAPGTRGMRLVGVDLSRQMLARAAETGLYAVLAHDTLEHHLQTTDERFDLVACCEVFIYIGDLEAAFAGARRVLRPGGDFLFCVEASDAGTGFDLLPSLRFAHSEAYIRRLADQHAFQVRTLARDVLREEGGQPMPGLYFHLVPE